MGDDLDALDIIAVTSLIGMMHEIRLACASMRMVAVRLLGCTFPLVASYHR